MRTRQARWRSALTESLHDGFFLASADGTVLEVNSAFRGILGYGPDAEAHQPTAPAVVARRSGRPRNAPPGRGGVRQDTAAADRQLHRATAAPPRKAQIWAAVTFGAVDDPDSGRRMLVGTIRDVTAERLAVQRETAVAGMTARLSAAVTRDGVLAAGLAATARPVCCHPGYRGRLGRRRETPRSSPRPGGTDPRDELPRAAAYAGSRSLRSQPALQITATADSARPELRRSAVEYSGNVVALWVELDSRPPFGLEDRTLLALLCGRTEPGAEPGAPTRPAA